MKAYVRSTSRFRIRIPIVVNVTTPRITGRSLPGMAPRSIPQRPGGPNTVSMKITPPSAVPMSMPIIVTTGSIALRITWWRSTCASQAPFARAVRTYSSSIVSMTLARIMRA
jgi:hypothetical protein